MVIEVSGGQTARAEAIAIAFTFDDEGHGIYKAGNREKLLLRMERFFGKAFA
jgi:dipeptidyl aminopeptidase/acylaminoacyl peptidase